MIKGTDVGFSGPEKEAIFARISQVVNSSYVMWGDQQEEFQKRMAALTRRKYAMTYSHVTLAAEAIFYILKPKIVAVQGNQFPSVIFAARRHGARVEWVDIDIEAMAPCLRLEMGLPCKPDVLVWEHCGGFIAEWFPEVRQWCDQHGVFLLEDASQAMGSRLGDEHAGHWGHASVISLSGTKFLTTGGQGGIVVFDQDSLWDRLFHLKVYGRSEMFQRGIWLEEGWNGQMTEPQAAFGNALLPFLDQRIVHRQHIAEGYQQLGTVVKRLGNYSRSRPNLYKYPVLLPVGVNRTWFGDELLKRGVQLSSGIYNEPMYRIKPFGNDYESVLLTNTEAFAARHVCLPMHNEMSVDDAQVVCAAVWDLLK